jgi:hypothetical protein
MLGFLKNSKNKQKLQNYQLIKKINKSYGTFKSLFIPEIKYE